MLPMQKQEKHNVFRQVKTTRYFTSHKIFQNLTCKSKFFMYLMKCTLCKFKYVGKSEISFNLGLNNNRSDIFDRNTIPACRHFVQDKYRFNRHAKFTLIESITNTNKPRKALQELLKRQENFWIKPLETLQPHGMYHELNPA